MTTDEIRQLDAWVRRITATHTELPDPWRVVVPPFGGADLIVQVDPVESERRGHGQRTDEVFRISVDVSFGAARGMVLGRLARLTG